MTGITIPTFLLGSVIAWLIGALVHLITGGKFLRLIFCIIFAWIGFWAGNTIGGNLNLVLYKYGQIDLGISVPISIGAALFGYWLSGENRVEQ